MRKVLADDAILDDALAVWLVSDSQNKNLLCRWAIDSFRVYLAANRNPQTITNNLPALLRIVAAHVADVALGYEYAAQDSLESPGGAAVDRRKAKALRGLLVGVPV